MSQKKMKIGKMTKAIFWIRSSFPYLQFVYYPVLFTFTGLSINLLVSGKIGSISLIMSLLTIIFGIITGIEFDRQQNSLESAKLFLAGGVFLFSIWTILCIVDNLWKPVIWIDITFGFFYLLAIVYLIREVINNNLVDIKFSFTSLLSNWELKNNPGLDEDPVTKTKI